MSMTHEHDVLKSENLDKQFAEMQEFVRRAARDGQAIHEVERGLWQRLRQMGHECLGQFLRLQGDGDMGTTVTLPTGEQCHRLEELHERRYASIFGEFHLRRVVYGSREGQKLDFVPLNIIALASSATTLSANISTRASPPSALSNPVNTSAVCIAAPTRSGLRVASNATSGRCLSAGSPREEKGGKKKGTGTFIIDQSVCRLKDRA